MKIDVALPAVFEQKWRRLRTYLEDDQILALAAVDLLWDRLGDEVRHAECLNAAHEKRLRECKRRLDGLRTRKVSMSPSVLAPVFGFKLPLSWFGKSPVDGVVLSGRLRYAVVRIKRSTR